MTETISTPTSEERNWALAAHLGPLLLSFIAPLVIWLVKKDESEYIADQAREALNFQITLFFAYLACIVLTFLLIGILLLPLVGLAQLILSILAALASSRGERYRYPFAIRLVS